MEPDSSRWCAAKGQEAHFAAGGSPTGHKGEKGKKKVIPVRAVKPWKRLSRVAELPFWEMFKA